MKKTDNYKFITKGNISGIPGETFIKNLKRYESTGLTPQQIKDMQFCLREKSRECAELRREIQELKERDTAKRPVEFDEHWYKCPGCGKYAGGLKGNFCHVCGQAIQWNENLEGMRFK